MKEITDVERLHEVRERLITTGSYDRRSGKTTYHCHCVAGMLELLEPGSTIFVVMEWSNRFRHFQTMLMDVLCETSPGLLESMDLRFNSLRFKNGITVRFICPTDFDRVRGVDSDSVLILDVENLSSCMYSEVYTLTDIRWVINRVRHAMRYEASNPYAEDLQSWPSTKGAYLSKIL